MPRPASRPTKPTLLSLARDLGVSRASVSNAYNRPDQLSADLRQRILARAAEVGFAGPDPVARGLRRRRIGAIGLVIDEPLSYAFADPAAVIMFDGLAEAVQEDRRAMLLVPANEAAHVELVTDAAVDGWVLYPLGHEHPFLAALLRRNEPIVSFDQPDIDVAAHVVVDDAGGTAAATRHLLGLGHRRLAVLSLPLYQRRRTGPVDLASEQAATVELSRRRLQGVRAAVRARRGVSVDVFEVAYNAPAPAIEVLAEVLARPERPTAVVALSDQLALGAVAAARAAGLEVPRDLSVTGFDDVPAAQSSTPPLTTVRQPLRERGLLAGRLVADLLHDRPVPRVTELPTELIVRGSTAPAVRR